MIDPQTEKAIRAYAAERGFHPTTLERWLVLAPADATALWDLTRDLRLGENQARDLWEWAEETAARDRLSLAAVLAEVVAAAGRTGGRNERLKAVKSALRRRRYPQLVAAEDRIATLVRQLGLPRTVRFTIPDNLEGDEIRVEIVARNAAALQAAAAEVERAASTSACEEIFELLSDPPEPARRQ
jgi:hypothetical protein